MVRSLTWALECDRPQRRRSVLLQVLEVDLEEGRRFESGVQVDPLTRQVPTFWSTGSISFDDQSVVLSFILLHQQTEDQRFDSGQLQYVHPES